MNSDLLYVIFMLGKRGVTIYTLRQKWLVLWAFLKPTLMLIEFFLFESQIEPVGLDLFVRW